MKRDPGRAVPFLLGAAAFILLFRGPATTLVLDWWNDPEASHGLLLGPLAVFLAWRSGLVSAKPWPLAGLMMLCVAVLIRFVSELAVELYTMRMSMFLALGALIVAFRGPRQLRHWWLPVSLLVLSVPLPQMVLGKLALPLQLQASAIGAGLLEARNVPVLVDGNIIRLPGQSLFVAEACSGLRSLTALLSLGVLMGGLFLRRGWTRAFIVLMTIPLAVVVNGVRVFMTGFLVYFVDPSFGDGFMHYTEGWALFMVSFSIVGGATWVLAALERWMRGRGARTHAIPTVVPA
jgi:exosortase